nr:LysR family transcriptional regulator [Dechloromonas sp.]
MKRKTDAHHHFLSGMPEISPGDLAMLIRAAELGSFSAVARERDLPTSNVSRAIQRLEKAWKVSLLRRSTHGLSVTPEGELAIEMGRQGLAALAEIGTQLAAPRHEISGTVRLALSAAYAESLVVPALPRLAERHPALRVELVTDDRVANLPLEGADLALRIGNVQDEDLVARQIGWNGRGLYCSPAYAARHGTPQTPAELDQHDVIGHQSARNLNRIRLAIDGRVDERIVNGRYSANTTAVIAQMVLLGLGIGNLNRSLIQAALREGRLIEVLADWRDPTEYPVYVLMLPDRQRLPRIQAMIAFLAEIMADASLPVGTAKR